MPCLCLIPYLCFVPPFPAVWLYTVQWAHHTSLRRRPRLLPFSKFLHSSPFQTIIVQLNIAFKKNIALVLFRSSFCCTKVISVILSDCMQHNYLCNCARISVLMYCVQCAMCKMHKVQCIAARNNAFPLSYASFSSLSYLKPILFFSPNPELK